MQPTPSQEKDFMNREENQKGINSDIWAPIYLLLEKKGFMPEFNKVKSHAILEQVFALQNSIETNALHELADAAPDMFIDHQGDRAEEIKAVQSCENQLEAICTRNAHIQASIWRGANKPPAVAADIVQTAEDKGLKWRQEFRENTEQQAGTSA